MANNPTPKEKCIAVKSPSFTVSTSKYTYALIDADGEIAYFVNRQTCYIFVDPRWQHLEEFFKAACENPAI